MAPAADVMSAALGEAKVQAPLVPLCANVTAAAVADPDTICDLLVQQVTGTVRWRESVEAMAAAGVTKFVEFGGKVLGPMIKRINADVTTRSVVTMADMEAFAGRFDVLSLRERVAKTSVLPFAKPELQLGEGFRTQHECALPLTNFA